MRNIGFVSNLIFMPWRHLIIQLYTVQGPAYAKQHLSPEKKKFKRQNKTEKNPKIKSTNKILSKWVLHKLLFFARKILKSLAVKNPYYHILFCCLLSKTLLRVSRLVLGFHQAVREKSCGLLPPTARVSLAPCRRNGPSTKTPLDKKQ